MSDAIALPEEARAHTFLDDASALPTRQIVHTLINPAHPWEVTVGQRIAAHLADTNGHILTALEISDTRERLIEIDNLLVCDRGLFVIECKAFRGRIEGGLNLEWEITHGDTRRRIKCHRGINPRHQCRQQVFTVVEALERIGARRDFWVNGAVLFPDETEFDLGSVPVNAYSRTNCPVYHLSEFIRALSELPRLPGACGDPDEIELLVNKLRR